MTDVKYIGGNPICDATAREQVEQIGGRLDAYEEIFTSDVGESVQNWLDEHPEATTTVQDGSITKAKLANDVKNDLSSAYYGYEYTEETANDTAYYIVTVPKVNYDGNPTVWHAAIADNIIGTTKTVRELAVEKTASVTINGGFFDTATGIPEGCVIVDGAVKYSGGTSHTPNGETLGILSDGSFRYYDSDNINTNTMLSDGVQQAVTGMGAIVKNGAVNTEGLLSWSTSVSRWQVIGYDANNYYVFTSETGMTISQVATLLASKGWTEAYTLDGGGSASTNLASVKINSNKDDDGTTDRKVPTFLYVTKTIQTRQNKDQSEFGKLLGIVKTELMQKAKYSDLEAVVKRVDIKMGLNTNITDYALTLPSATISFGTLASSGTYIDLPAYTADADNYKYSGFIIFSRGENNKTIILFPTSRDIGIIVNKYGSSFGWTGWKHIPYNASATVTGTTTESGNIYLNVDRGVVVNHVTVEKIDNAVASGIVIPYISNNNGRWYGKVYDLSNNLVESKAVELTVYYSA